MTIVTVTVVLCCGFTRLATGAEFVELHIPLEDGRFYAVDRLLEECNQHFGTQYAVERYRGRKRVISPAERAALILANEVGLIEATFAPDCLTLRFPNPNDDQTRHKIRQQFARWFKLPVDQWPPGRGLHVPDDFDSRRPTLIQLLTFD